ncbi:hypothetical protein RSOLAG22IIIB_11009 [Rhizoctonia solani]|uniref:Ricin B lectin domain-containing protein n=1 Tax=Rhizoctonia solani TaxID=456999 RepID=A0A0K6G6S3_9AGAM|nr:hypothetical protein RSOLAG22IIIB_11009 [Rhizoctonia solani]
MSGIEPGTYRIINKRDSKAITIPDNQLGTIMCKPVNRPNQKWFVRRSGNYYQFEDCSYGKYIAPDNTKLGTRINVERHPVEWEILPHHNNEYVIKLVGHDLVLDSHSDEEVHAWQRNETVQQRLWKFEWLSNFSGDSSRNRTDLTSVTKDKLITRLTEQLEQKDIQLAVQDRMIQEHRRDIVQKEQEITRVNGELNRALISLARRNESIGFPENPIDNCAENEIGILREKVDRLESLLNKYTRSRCKWLGEGTNRLNDVS